MRGCGDGLRSVQDRGTSVNQTLGFCNEGTAGVGVSHMVGLDTWAAISIEAPEQFDMLEG